MKKIKNKKKKFSWVAVGNMVGLLSSILVILESMYQVIFKMQTLTYFGLGVVVVAFIVCGANFNYFDEKLSK